MTFSRKYRTVVTQGVIEEATTDFAMAIGEDMLVTAHNGHVTLADILISCKMLVQSFGVVQLTDGILWCSPGFEVVPLDRLIILSSCQ